MHTFTETRIAAAASHKTVARLLKLLPVLFFGALTVLPTFASAVPHSLQPNVLLRNFKMPDTPFLPPYCGRIVSGEVLKDAQADGGISYCLTFETAEQPTQVIGWYKKALELYGWNFDKQEVEQFHLSAHHGSNIVTNIFLLSPRKAGAAAQVQMYYRYRGKDM